MKCPHCGETLPFQICPKCGGETPEKSLYCCYCSNAMKPDEGTKVEEKETDISDRTLCSDGNCIGIINEKGICNVCGKPYGAMP